ncbi:MAG: zf-HC2 domain-containing protein [Planctomycetes bacterium]|nr:zf-HC2 domain-containing protein [Planctomycetota bacterium]
MPLLDDLWAQGDREGVFQRVLPMLYEAPVLFGGPEGLRKPFLAEAVRAWDAGSLVPRGKAARPIEAALLAALRDLYVAWAAKLSVGAPDPGDDKLNVSGLLDDLGPLESGLIKAAQIGLRFTAPSEAAAIAAAADAPLGKVMAGLARSEHARREAFPDRAKALDKFALARATGASAEALVAWAVQARENFSASPADLDAGIGWAPGTTAERLAKVREAVIAKLTAGRKGAEESPDCPSFASLSRYIDEALPQKDADAVAEHIDGCMTCTKTTGRIARLAALAADATLGTWEPAAAPGPRCPSTADFAGWTAGGRSDVDEHVASCTACYARGVDVFRAIAAKEGRTLPAVPAEAVPKRTSSTAPAVAAAAAAPAIRMRGYPGHLDVIAVPEGISKDEDGYMKGFSWRAGSREVLADVSPSGGGLGLRLRVRDSGEPAGGVPVLVTDTRSRKSFSNRPTDRAGEVLVRGMPLQSFRVEVADVPVDVVFEG